MSIKGQIEESQNQEPHCKKASLGTKINQN
jgi:hypothetical protein